MNNILPYHSNFAILLDKMIARSGDMYRDDSGIFCLGHLMFRHHKHFGTKISLFEFPLLKLCLRKLKVFFNKVYIDV